MINKFPPCDVSPFYKAAVEVQYKRSHHYIPKRDYSYLEIRRLKNKIKFLESVIQSLLCA